MGSPEGASLEDGLPNEKDGTVGFEDSAELNPVMSNLNPPLAVAAGLFSLVFPNKDTVFGVFSFFEDETDEPKENEGAEADAGAEAGAGAGAGFLLSGAVDNNGKSFFLSVEREPNENAGFSSFFSPDVAPKENDGFGLCFLFSVECVLSKVNFGF